MKNFIVYAESGKILRTGTCSAEAIEFQCSEGEFVIEGVANDATQQIVNGVVVEKPEASDEEKAEKTRALVRQLRNSALTNSDWTQMPDSPLSDEAKTAWALYRRQLREMPERYTEPIAIEDVVFPSPPE